VRQKQAILYQTRVRGAARVIDRVCPPHATLTLTLSSFSSLIHSVTALAYISISSARTLHMSSSSSSSSRQQQQRLA